MQQPSLVCRHIAANCNPQPNVLRFLTSDLLLFAFSSQAALYSLSQNRVLHTITNYSHHHKRINCLAPSQHSQTHLLFCAFDSGYLAVFSSPHQKLDWAEEQLLKMSHPAISIEVLKVGDQHHLLMNDSGSNVRHFVKKGTDSLVEKECLHFPENKFVQAICPLFWGGRMAMFLGGVDGAIYCYEKELEGKGEFQFLFLLQGHENGITKLVVERKGEEFLLASSSRDGLIRVWRMSGDEGVIKFHKNVFRLFDAFYIYLESVLLSHECSVTSLAWTNFDNSLQLVSSSLDSTLCVWEQIEGSWSVKTRLGQFLGNKNAYFDVKGHSGSQLLIALNYTGAVLVWERREQTFKLRESFNGHASSVNDLEWNLSGDFLVSVSSDQTTRVLAKEKTSGNYSQISRAQIHGYDINAVSTLSLKETTVDVIVCGADEKVVRIIEPPACFANFLNSYTSANLHLLFHSQQQENKYLISAPTDPILLYESYAEGGSQVLGLMTKVERVERERITSYYEEEEDLGDEEKETTQVVGGRMDFSSAPHEDFLVKHTLWPEANKLYGHPHEIHKLARNKASTMLASVCKALNKESASILIWKVPEWKLIKVLPFHNYTVNALSFSPCDRFLASASKDRKLAIFSDQFELLFAYEAHSRAVTGLSFHTSSQYIATGSRDKTIKLHSVPQRKALSQLNLGQPVSSLAFGKTKQTQNCLVVGCFSGDLFVCWVKDEVLVLGHQLPPKDSHRDTVNCVKWNEKGAVATASDDFSVRIFDIQSQ